MSPEGATQSLESRPRYKMWSLLSLAPRSVFGEHCLLLRVDSRLDIVDGSLCTDGLCLQLSEDCGVPYIEDCSANLTVCGLRPHVNNGSTSNDYLLEEFYSRYPVNDWPYFTEDFFNLINRHWLTFEPPGRNLHLMFMAFYLLLAIFGLPGNAMVIFMISRCKSLRTPSNLLVLNLAISDFILVSKTPLFIYNSFKEGPALGSIGCQIFGFIGGMTGTCSIMTLAAIALDRYYVIANPLNRNYPTRLKAFVSIILIWLYSVGFSAIPLAGVGIKAYVPEGFLTSCSFDYLDNSKTNVMFIFGFFVAAWLIPFIIIVFSYIGICRAVLLVSFATRKGQEKEKRKKELKLAVIVIIVVSLWFTAWTPYAIVALLGIFGQKSFINPLTSMIPAIFCKTASCIDPFVYSLSHPKLKDELFKLMCPKRYAMERAETQKSIWKTSGSRCSTGRRDNRTSIMNATNQVELIELKNVGRSEETRRSTTSSLNESGNVGMY